MSLAERATGWHELSSSFVIMLQFGYLLRYFFPLPFRNRRYFDTRDELFYNFFYHLMFKMNLGWRCGSSLWFVAYFVVGVEVRASNELYDNIHCLKVGSYQVIHHSSKHKPH